MTTTHLGGWAAHPRRSSTDADRRGGRSALVLVGLLVLCQLVGISGIPSGNRGDGSWYDGLERPAWEPPSWAFAVVWPILYALMAVAAWLVWRTASSRPRTAALRWFAVQLVLNGAWTWAFFGAKAPWLGLVVIVALLIALAITVVRFAPVDRRATWLLAPYVAWVVYATALNTAIAVLQ